MSRIIYFLEPLTNHSDLDVQELAVEYLELIRLAMEAASSQNVSDDGAHADPPLLLTQVLPSLFTGFELKPIAPGAQEKIQPPDDLDLDTPINCDLNKILQDADNDSVELEQDDFEEFYHIIPESTHVPETAADRLDLAAKSDTYSYQEESIDPATLVRSKAARRERNKDDPFYIPSEDDGNASAAARLDRIIQTSNGENIDIDAIPIMELTLEGPTATEAAAERAQAEGVERRRKAAKRKAIQIVADETIGEEIPPSSGQGSTRSSTPNPLSAAAKAKKSLLDIDSSGLRALALEGRESGRHTPLDIEQREEEERALKEVERLRLEMQRASERIQAKEAVTVVRKKKKKPKTSAAETGVEEDGQPAEAELIPEGSASTVKKKKKKKSTGDPNEPVSVEAKPKKKKRRAIDLSAPVDEEAE
jgi:AP-3 complex subunit delta-1